MPDSAPASYAPIGEATLASFAFVLARLTGAFAFIPLPGFRTAPLVPRIVLVVGLTIALLPAWPVVKGQTGLHLDVWWLAAEASLGIAAGAIVSWLNEAFVMAMQMLGLQAGYSYASTIDPSTQADSAVLQIFAQLAAGMLFFLAGGDRELLRALGSSFDAFPPGTYSASADLTRAVIAWSASAFNLALRLALPVIALLGLVDLALALLGRLQNQLQLVSLAFPAKMAVAMVALAWGAGLVAAVYESAVKAMVGELWRAIR